MFELVAGLTVVFAGYVLYEVFKTVSETNHRPPVAGPDPEKTTLPREIKPEAAKPEAAKPVEAPPPAAEPVPGPTVEVSAEPSPLLAASSAPPTADKVISTLRNPATGDTCPVPTNYRFAKKWVKEALVAEGLLDKVYKAADLDDRGSQQVKEAIGRLKSIEKYQG